MNIGVLSKILGHNSIKVTLDSYGTIIDELMLRSVKELKEKLTIKSQLYTNPNETTKSDVHQELIKKINGTSKN